MDQELIHLHSFLWKKAENDSVAEDEGKAIFNQIIVFQNLFAD